MSAFASILQRLVEASPGAVGAVLADEEGETVDLYGDIDDPDALKLAAAYMGILLRRLGSSPPRLATWRWSSTTHTSPNATASRFSRACAISCAGS